MNFRRRLLIEISTYVGIIAVLLITLYFLRADITKRTNAITELRGRLNFWAQSTQSLALLKQDAFRANDYSAAIQAALPTKDQLINFSPDIKSIAVQNKVNLNLSLGNQTITTENALTATDLSFTVRGELQDLTNFLAAASNSKYPVKLSSLNLIKEPDNIFTLSSTGKIFSY